MTCSAISFSSCSSSCSSSRSSCLVDPAGARARDRPVADQSVVDAHQHLGRGADDLDLAGVQEVHVGRGIERAQHAIEGEGIDRARSLELLTRHDLEDVAGEDVLARSFDDRPVVGAGEVRESLGDRADVDRGTLARRRGDEALGRGITRRLGTEQDARRSRAVVALARAKTSEGSSPSSMTALTTAVVECWTWSQIRTAPGNEKSTSGHMSATGSRGRRSRRRT